MSTPLQVDDNSGLTELLNPLESVKEELAKSLTSQLLETHGLETTLGVLARMYGYKDTPPTINTVIDNSNYLGNMLSDNLFPLWRSVLNNIYPNQFYSPYIEVCVSGSIGSGKSTLSLAGIFYDLIRLLHLKDPHKIYRLVKSTKIYFAFINATLSLSQSVLYGQAMDWIAMSPYFSSLVNKNYRPRINPLFPNNIDFIVGSRFSHVLGNAIFSGIMSEVNFQDKIADQAYENYTNLKRRMQSRFLQSGGTLPSRIWLDSSKAGETSFLTKHIEASRTDPKVLVVDYPIWEVKNHLGIYSGKTFKVFIGNATRDPFIVKYPDQTYGLDDFVIDVPIEYRHEFEMDLNNSLRDIAGKSTRTNQLFISSKEKIQEALTVDNPVFKEVIELDFFDSNDKLINYVDYSKIRKDNRPRFMHIDLGIKSDKTGIALSRIEGWVETERTDVLTGKSNRIKEPVFYTDMVLAVTGKLGQEMPIFKIKEFVIDLLARSYPLACVTTDGYQSTNLRQDLMFLGIDTELLSVDKTKGPYERLKYAVLESRYHGPNHPILKYELENLLDTGAKIDHGISGCFTGDTLIRTSLGPKRIDEIREGDSVYSYNIENKLFEVDTVKSSRETLRVDELVELELSNGSIIRCTLDHRFLLLSGEYKKAKDLTEDDEIVSMELS